MQDQRYSNPIPNFDPANAGLLCPFCGFMLHSPTARCQRCATGLASESPSPLSLASDADIRAEVTARIGRDPLAWRTAGLPLSSPDVLVVDPQPVFVQDPAISRIPPAKAEPFSGPNPDPHPFVPGPPSRLSNAPFQTAPGHAFQGPVQAPVPPHAPAPVPTPRLSSPVPDPLPRPNLKPSPIVPPISTAPVKPEFRPTPNLNTSPSQDSNITPASNPGTNPISPSAQVPEPHSDPKA